MCISKKSGTSSAKISKSFVATTFCIDSASLVQTLLTPPERLRRSFTASSVCKFPFKVTLIVTRFLYFQGYVKWVKNDYSIEALCHQEKCLGFHNDHLYKRIPMTHSSFFLVKSLFFLSLLMFFYDFILACFQFFTRIALTKKTHFVVE